jgi:nucleotide-binding universal stress UspA family protein
MAQNILVALDGSEGAWRAVEYAAKAFGSAPGVKITLLHILTGLPPAFWDDGHVLKDKEREARQRMVANWQSEQEKRWDDLVARARQHLVAAGLPETGVAAKFKTKYFDVGEDILNEAAAGGCQTIIMGRRGLGKAKALLLGSVTTKVAQNAKGCAVTIVS